MSGLLPSMYVWLPLWLLSAGHILLPANAGVGKTWELELVQHLIKCYKTPFFNVDSTLHLQPLISESCYSLVMRFRCKRKDSTARGAVLGNYKAVSRQLGTHMFF